MLRSHSFIDRKALPILEPVVVDVPGARYALAVDCACSNSRMLSFTTEDDSILAVSIGILLAGNYIGGNNGNSK